MRWGWTLAAALFVAGAAAADSERQRAVDALLNLYDLEAREYDELLFDFRQTLVREVLQSIRSGGYPTIGSSGPVIIEFADYQCGFCKRQYPALAAAVEAGQARVAVVELPFLGAASETAARYALAAQQQGQYAAMHGKIMRAEHVDEEQLDGIASELGLDLARLKADMETQQVAEQIEHNFYLAQILGIRGTPVMFFGDRRVSGLLRDADFQDFLAAATESP